MRLPDIESARIGMKHGPLIFGFLNCVFLGIFIISILGLKDRAGFDVAVVLVVSFLSGVVLGGYYKYRSKLSVGFGLAAIIYFFILFGVLLSGGVVMMFIYIARLDSIKWIALGACQMIIFSTLSVGFFRGKSSLRRDDEHLSKVMKDSINFDKYVIDPNPSETPPSKPPFGLLAILSVNIPFGFYIFTGARENGIYLAMPVMIGIMAYLNVMTFGPRLAGLWFLREHEKMVGRCFVNADYEKIQDLRRTFFLSRWLMKDYRPTTGNRQAS